MSVPRILSSPLHLSPPPSPSNMRFRSIIWSPFPSVSPRHLNPFQAIPTIFPANRIFWLDLIFSSNEEMKKCIEWGVKLTGKATITKPPSLSNQLLIRIASSFDTLDDMFADLFDAYPNLAPSLDKTLSTEVKQLEKKAEVE